MQRILSTRNPREASLMSAWVNVVLIFPRYFLITGLTILALAFYSDQIRAIGNHIDFEMVPPYALGRFGPVGRLGLDLAGLLAAFMSNFAATVNAAPPYIVNDIYKRFINPHASPRTYVRLSYLSSFAVVVAGIAFGWFVGSINSVIEWIVSALWGGYTASNVLKWYWWRFNGYGYFWGNDLRHWGVSNPAGSCRTPRRSTHFQREPVRANLRSQYANLSGEPHAGNNNFRG